MNKRWMALLTCGVLVFDSVVTTAQVTGQEQAAAPKKSVTVTYLANEGLMLTAGGQSVLIDALFREGVASYATIPPETLEKLELAAAPFDKIKLVLVTHEHADHFDAASVARHLAGNKHAVLISSEQVTGKVLRAAAEQEVDEGRIRAYLPEPNEKAVSEADGIRVEILKLSHGAGRFGLIANLAFIVHLGGHRILHVGDADLRAESLDPLRQHAGNIDVACVPFWWLTSPPRSAFLRETLKPKHVVAIHIAPQGAAEVAEQIRQSFPDAMICTQPMMERGY